VRRRGQFRGGNKLVNQQLRHLNASQSGWHGNVKR
jgi:hypothetical protein